MGLHVERQFIGHAVLVTSALASYARLPAGTFYRPVSDFNRAGTNFCRNYGGKLQGGRELLERVETHLLPLPTSPREARMFLRDALETWALDGFGAVTEVLADELVANVVRHVDAPMTFRACRLPGSIRVEVDDPSSDPPVQSKPDPLSESGRGLLLLSALADQWGVTHYRDDGKTVWFEIDVATATEEVHRDMP